MRIDVSNRCVNRNVTSFGTTLPDELFAVDAAALLSMRLFVVRLFVCCHCFAGRERSVGTRRTNDIARAVVSGGFFCLSFCLSCLLCVVAFFPSFSLCVALDAYVAVPLPPLGVAGDCASFDADLTIDVVEVDEVVDVCSEMNDGFFVDEFSAACDYQQTNKQTTEEACSMD